MLRSMIVSLVIIMTVGGMDYERRKEQPSLAVCWQQAAEAMDQMMKQEHKDLTQIGIGCVVDKAGDPA